MDIIFHIEYYVYAGEQVAINIVDAADGVTLHRHLMTTADNAHWTFDWNADAWTADAADYFFTIERADTTLRREWTAIRHRLDLPRRPQTSVRVYCRWIDMPHDTYRYSSAFTEASIPIPYTPSIRPATAACDWYAVPRSCARATGWCSPAPTASSASGTRSRAYP